MVTPENDNGVVRIGALLKGVQYPSNHGVGITYVGEVAVYGIVPGIQRLQFLEYEPESKARNQSEKLRLT